MLNGDIEKLVDENKKLTEESEAITVADAQTQTEKSIDSKERCGNIYIG